MVSYNSNHSEGENYYYSSKPRGANKPRKVRKEPISPLEYRVHPNITYKRVEQDFFRHIPSLDIVWLRDEQMPGILGMTYINSNYIILRESLRDMGDRKLEVEVHETKHQMNFMNSEREIRQNTKNMFEETYYHQK